MSAEWTITGLTYDREKAERTLGNLCTKGG